MTIRIKTRPIKDMGNARLARHHRIRPMIVNGETRIRNLDATEIDRMLVDGKLNPDEHGALSRLQDDLHRAHMVGPRAQNYERPFGTGYAPEVTERDADALHRVSQAVDFLTKKAGRYVCDMLLSLCMVDRMIARVDLPSVRAAADAFGCWRGR